MFWVCGTSFYPHLPLCFHCNLTTKKKSTNKNISDTKKETLSVMVFTFSSFIGFSNLNPTSREATIHSSIHILGTRCAVQIKNYLAAESLNFRTPTSEKEPWPQTFGGWGEPWQKPGLSNPIQGFLPLLIFDLLPWSCNMTQATQICDLWILTFYPKS